MTGAHLLYGDWHGKWPEATRGKGVFVYDRSGRDYLDAVGGSHVVTIGHGVEEIAEAMSEQARRLPYASTRVWASTPQLELAELISTLTPDGLDWVYFTSGGSEGTEIAIQLAHQFQVETGNPRRYKVLGRDHSYHGGTLAAIEVGGHAVHRDRLAAFLTPQRRVVSPDCAHCPLRLDYPSCGIRCADDLAAAIEEEGPQTVSAFIFEPIGGTTSGGMVPPAGYYEAVRRICDRYGVLLIADEVVTGFGRTGRSFAIDYWDVVPDIMVCSKGLTSGYAPLGAVIASRDIASAIQNGSGKVPMRLTYSGHPVSCAAGLAVQRYVIANGLVARCAEVGGYLRQELTRLREDLPFVSRVSGRGLLLGVELMRHPERRIPFDRSERAHERVAAEGFSQGIVLMGGGGTARSPHGDHILVSPPFTISKAECDILVSRLRSSIANALQDV